MNQDRLIMALAERVFAQSELLSKRAERPITMEPMTPDEYKAVIRGITQAAFIVDQFDLDKIMNAIISAETVGPIMNPTLWIQKREALEQDKEIVKAALPLKRLAAMILDYRAKKEERET